MYHTLTSRALLAAFGITMLAVIAPVGAARSQAPSGDRVTSLNITILSTMLADEGFGEWGFAALVEVDGRRILFDTGANDDTVARNLKALGLDLGRVQSVVLSHNHADHTTGLMPLRGLAGSRSKSLTTLYVGTGIFLPRVAADGRVDERMASIRREYESTGGRVVEVDAPMRLHPGVWLTGRVPRVHAERNWSGLGKVRLPNGDQDDTVPEDMALVVQTSQGVVVLFGCGHAGVINTLEHVRKTIDPSGVKAIIGGLHLFNADEAHLAWTASHLRRFGVQQLLGAHCTGVEAVYRLRALAGLTRQTCMVGAVGATYSLERGINPLRVAR
jgi:7,8-dihydropterin-6-yl-methyl-4-(beta-D-ribofuranosyl)aminobenzene 5'-phosphate synthase